MAPHIIALIKNRQHFLKYVQISRSYLRANPRGPPFTWAKNSDAGGKYLSYWPAKMSKFSIVGKLFALKPRETSVKIWISSLIELTHLYQLWNEQLGFIKFHIFTWDHEAQCRKQRTNEIQKWHKSFCCVEARHWRTQTTGDMPKPIITW